MVDASVQTMKSCVQNIWFLDRKVENTSEVSTTTSSQVAHGFFWSWELRVQRNTPKTRGA